MREMSDIREIGAFVPIEFDNELSGQRDSVHVTMRHAEILQVSKRSADFCSSRGATSIIDLPTELLEFFTARHSAAMVSTVGRAGVGFMTSAPIRLYIQINGRQGLFGFLLQKISSE